jgi:hypothetical protein
MDEQQQQAQSSGFSAGGGSGWTRVIRRGLLVVGAAIVGLIGAELKGAYVSLLICHQHVTSSSYAF